MDQLKKKKIEKIISIVYILSLALLGVGSLVFLIYGAVNGNPYADMEMKYQIDTFGFYDSNIIYLQDVYDAKMYWGGYVIGGVFGLAFFFLLGICDFVAEIRKKVNRNTNEVNHDK